MPDILELECPTCGALLDDNSRCWRCDYEELQRKANDRTHDLERKLQEKEQQIKDLQYDLADAQRENMTMTSVIAERDNTIKRLRAHIGEKFGRG